jgi:hypothetical protein
MSHGKSRGRHVKVFAASVVVASLLTGCLSDKKPTGQTPPPRPSGTSSPPDTTVISKVPSIVPFVDAELKRMGFNLPLERNKDECHPGQPSHTGTSGNTVQTCRWHRDEIGGTTSYRILSVTVNPEIDSEEARQDMMISTKLGLAPRPVRLGDEATAGAIDAPNRLVMIRGREDTLAITGANLAVRLHNVTIDVEWLGANYKMEALGSPTDIQGLPRELATRQAVTIAKAIIAHLR